MDFVFKDHTSESEEQRRQQIEATILQSYNDE